MAKSAFRLIIFKYFERLHPILQLAMKKHRIS